MDGTLKPTSPQPAFPFGSSARIDRGRRLPVAAALIACAVACRDPAPTAPCNDCRIAMEPIVRLDFREAPGSMSSRFARFHIAHDAELSRFVVATDRVPTPIVFDRDGAFVGILGNEGSGPGEYQQSSVRGVAVDATGSVVVYTSARRDVYGSDLVLRQSSKQESIEAVSMLPDGSELIQRGGATPTFHVIDAAGRHVRSVGRGDSLDIEPPHRLFALAGDRGFWSTRFNHYDLLHLSADGDTVARLRAAPEWWRAAPLDENAAAFMDLRPATLGLSEDDGVLWVHAGVPVADAEALRAVLAGQSSARPELLRRLADHHLLAVDARTGRELAHERFDFRPLVLLDHGIAAEITEDTTGELYITLVGLTVARE